MLDFLQTIPHVKVIVSDEHKTICSVQICVERMERIDSGSMQFHLPRYITFGQTVVFTDIAISDDQSGALFFKVDSDEEAASIIDNIVDYLPCTKSKTDHSIVMEQKI